MISSLPALVVFCLIGPAIYPTNDILDLPMIGASPATGAGQLPQENQRQTQALWPV